MLFGNHNKSSTLIVTPQDKTLLFYIVVAITNLLAIRVAIMNGVCEIVILNLDQIGVYPIS